VAKKSLAPAGKPKKQRFAFIRNIIAELRKVVWPTRREAIRLTLMVLAVTISMGIVLGAIDFGFTAIVQNVLVGGN
jgi:preprotein translocase subunit SecE